MNELILEISSLIKTTVRKEDIVYLIDSDRPLWGVLMMTNDVDSTSIVSERISEKINQIHIDGYQKGKSVKINLIIGQNKYDDSIKSSMDFISVAEKQMQYYVE